MATSGKCGAGCYAQARKSSGVNSEASCHLWTCCQHTASARGAGQTIDPLHFTLLPQSLQPFHLSHFSTTYSALWESLKEDERASKDLMVKVVPLIHEISTTHHFPYVVHERSITRSCPNLILPHAFAYGIVRNQILRQRDPQPEPVQLSLCPYFSASVLQ